MINSFWVRKEMMPMKGIEPEVEIDRDPQFKGKRGLKDQIEKKEEGEGLNRSPCQYGSFLSCGVDLLHPDLGEIRSLPGPGHKRF